MHALSFASTARRKTVILEGAFLTDTSVFEFVVNQIHSVDVGVYHRERLGPFRSGEKVSPKLRCSFR